MEKGKNLFTKIFKCVTMYAVKIGNFMKIHQNFMGKVLFSPDFPILTLLFFTNRYPSAAVGLKYIFGKRNFSIKIHLWRLYKNGTESPVCGDCSA